MKIKTLIGLFLLALTSIFSTGFATETMDAADLLQKLKQQPLNDLVILDVRSPEEFNNGHIPQAKNISYDEIADRLPELAPWKDKTIIVHCRSGRRAAIAEKVLIENGFKVKHLNGDFIGWQQANYPIEK